MNKKILLSISLLTAAAVGVSPVISYADEIKVVQVQPGIGYQIINGKEDECLQQILGEIDSIITNAGNYCSGIGTPDTGIPDVSTPDTNIPDGDVPEMPGTATPEIPDSGSSETPGTGVPNTPDNGSSEPSAPGAPNTPDNGSSEPSAPGVPDTPDNDSSETPETGAPDTPDTEKPSIQKPEEGTLDEAESDYAQQILNLVNARRAEAGLPALELKSDITAAANVRAKEIKQSFSHTRPDGSSFSSVLRELGISFRGSGENIAYGQQTPEQVMEAWMNSASHRANILNENFKNIGVGHYQDEKGVNYWVQLFTY